VGLKNGKEPAVTDQTGKDLEGAAELFYIQRDMGSQ
jgi:hypothetical protein